MSVDTDRLLPLLLSRLTSFPLPLHPHQQQQVYFIASHLTLVYCCWSVLCCFVVGVSRPVLKSTRPMRSEQPGAPVYRCTFTTISTGLVIPDCDVLLATGCLICDLLLPIREIVKLGIKASKTTRQAQPIDSPKVLIRMFETIEITMVFRDEQGREFPRSAGVQVWGNDKEWQAHVASTSINGEPSQSLELSTPNSLDSAFDHTPPHRPVRPPVNALTPIKHMRGTGRDRVILGLSGIQKLNIKWDSKTNSISLLDEPVWDM